MSSNIFSFNIDKLSLIFKTSISYPLMRTRTLLSITVPVDFSHAFLDLGSEGRTENLISGLSSCKKLYTFAVIDDLYLLTHKGNASILCFYGFCWIKIH